MTGMTNIEGN